MEQVQTRRLQTLHPVVLSRQFDLASFSETARRYEAAKARLLAAQEEKMEATAELMSLRESLAGFLETVWPEKGE